MIDFVFVPAPVPVRAPAFTNDLETSRLDASLSNSQVGFILFSRGERESLDGLVECARRSGYQAREYRSVRKSRRVRLHARSLLSIARSNITDELVFEDICRLLRIAQICGSFSVGFCPVNLPLFHGTLDAAEPFSVSMTISIQSKGDTVCATASGR
jgi:hypothetical protein